MTSHEESRTEAATETVTEIVLPGIVEPDGLLVRRRPVPSPAAGQALVCVEATGVSFAEQGMRRGRYPGQPKFPFVPGYDLVGTVAAVGTGVDAALVGTRVAALTKTGGWATHVLLTAADLVPVPARLEPVEAETVVVNGLTAWGLLHRTARVRRGQTILVHGANGGVGTVLAQLARHAGVRVIGAASPRHHDALRTLGVEPVDYADLDALVARVRELAPGGVDAVFDNIGGATLRRSWQLLAPRGTLVSYALAAAAKGSGALVPQFVAVLARLAWWNTLPNGHRATFYDVWSGRRLRPARFRARLHEDLGVVLGLLADGILRAEVGARFPLTEAGEAMRVAESHTVRGKVVLIP
ncbi:medium chain dehydrogenase/reductase family protein [Cellulomonas sp. KRMCY2]|uniref:medium chain dehydrogenase/reductase family protein n=1 Tax=Cellulomonas sp. KRMCY2 TaxID=1304865 RepID=UPI00045EB56E|nr:medium chain dehydrogenase/reductase family protein [Cellulomonas sp. KRMCY2]